MVWQKKRLLSQKKIGGSNLEKKMAYLAKIHVEAGDLQLQHLYSHWDSARKGALR